MMTNPRHQEPQLHWKWVNISVIVGMVLVGSSYFIVAPTFQLPEVQILVMLVGFIVMGAIIGYFSPGITIKESTVGGAIVLIIMLLLILITKAGDINQTFLLDVLLLLLGITFSWVGGWVGEQLQGSSEEDAPTHRGMQWKWIVIGIIVGFALNNFIVFVIGTLILRHLMKTSFVGFIISLMTTGFIVGMHSPGETLREPAIAGVIAVVLSWVFFEFIVGLHIPVTYLIIGLIMGFLFTLLGGWLGEKYQETLKGTQANQQ